MLPGAPIGPYRIVELIGEGGMGAVYRARDTRLQRDVAVKSVQAAFANDPDHLARFEREARLLASITHPNIATIYGLEEAEGVRFLVMELVPGRTLAKRLEDAPYGTKEALGIAAQVAAGLEGAHDRGVIHRDLKPANIMITPDGTVKLLDFGLAKALHDGAKSADALLPTVTSGGTAPGTVLGTAAYMSPEQARGSDLDRRTDVWAFGCVTYELLTGKRAFSGATLSDTLAAILTRDPDWTALPADLPRSVLRVLRRCLEKDVRRRLRDMSDIRLEIEEAIAAPDAPGSEVSTVGVAPGRRHFGWTALVVSAAAAALTTALIAWAITRDEPAPPAPVHFAMSLPDGHRIAGLDFPAIAISPTDSHVAFIASRGGQSQLYVRTLRSTDATPIAGTEGALSPFFSPDGSWIAFFAEGKLKKVPVGGGPVRTIADAPIGFGGAWGPDNQVVFAPNNGSALVMISADGGTARQVTKLDTARGEFSHRWPELLPDGDTVVYAIGTEGSWDDAAIVAQSIKSGERRTVVEGGTQPRYLSEGHLLYTRAGSLLSVELKPQGSKASGSREPKLRGVLQSSDGAAQFAVSRAGSLVYLTAGETHRRLVWVDRSGAAQALAAPRGPYSSPRLSPDGRTIALASGADREDVWLYDLSSGALTQFTFEGGTAPVWSADGTRLAFSAAREGPPAIFWKPVNNSGPEERLTNSSRAQVPHSISRDGEMLALTEFDSNNGLDLAVMRIGTEQTARAYRPSAARETAPVFSPDARLIAYVSDAGGLNQVYVAAADGTGRALRLSAEEGAEPQWNPNGLELFFRSVNKMVAVALRPRPSLSAGSPRVLFEVPFASGVDGRAGYDVSGDGARFLMLEGRDGAQPIQLVSVILHWSNDRR